jgi:NADH dehydrogenase (ubiquinone) Fe-S protein 1
MAELAPHLVKFDVIENSGFENLAFKFDPNNTKLNNTPLTDNTDNFYQTDAISRNS